MKFARFKQQTGETCPNLNDLHIGIEASNHAKPELW